MRCPTDVRGSVQWDGSGASRVAMFRGGGEFWVDHGVIFRSSSGVVTDVFRALVTGGRRRGSEPGCGHSSETEGKEALPQIPRQTNSPGRPSNQKLSTRSARSTSSRLLPLPLPRQRHLHQCLSLARRKNTRQHPMRQRRMKRLNASEFPTPPTDVSPSSPLLPFPAFPLFGPVNHSLCARE